MTAPLDMGHYYQRRGIRRQRAEAAQLEQEEKRREVTAADRDDAPVLEALAGHDRARCSVYDWAWLR